MPKAEDFRLTPEELLRRLTHPWVWIDVQGDPWSGDKPRLVFERLFADVNGFSLVTIDCGEQGTALGLSFRGVVLHLHEEFLRERCEGVSDEMQGLDREQAFAVLTGLWLTVAAETLLELLDRRNAPVAEKAPPVDRETVDDDLSTHDELREQWRELSSGIAEARNELFATEQSLASREVELLRRRADIEKSQAQLAFAETREDLDSLSELLDLQIEAYGLTLSTAVSERLAVLALRDVVALRMSGRGFLDAAIAADAPVSDAVSDMLSGIEGLLRNGDDSDE